MDSEQINYIKQEWQKHPYTAQLIKEIEAKYEKLHTECENLASSDLKDKQEIIIRKLVEAKTLKQIVKEYVK